MLPAGFRQKDQTQKAATGPFDREHLLMYLEKEALEQKDREDFVPFTGEKKGKGRRRRLLGQGALNIEGINQRSWEEGRSLQITRGIAKDCGWEMLHPE